MNIVRILAFAAVSIALPGAAHAHTGLHMLGDGMQAGFVHPFSGLDHLLTMIAVGLWAGLIGGRAQWLVPAAFVAVMTVGASLGAGGFMLPAVETAIIASVIAVGTLIAVRAQLSPAIAMVVVAVFALFHGYAHGSEMPAMASPLTYGLGFVAATVILHGIGLLGARGWRASPLLMRVAGGAIAAAGVVLAFPL